MSASMDRMAPVPDPSVYDNNNRLLAIPHAAEARAR
jgi:hypothetical protein